MKISLTLMNHQKMDTEDGGQVQTLTRPETRSRRPPLYKVILLNDDYSPMDFVVHILKKFFRKNEEEATEIMLQVHNQGSGVAGVFTYEIAETKVFQVNDYSRKHKHPLKCILEKETHHKEDSDA